MPTTPPTSLTGRDIIVTAVSEWEGARRIRHHLSEELARRGNRVLFVEMYYTLSKFARMPQARKLIRFSEGPRKIGENLYAVAAPPLLPGGEFSEFLNAFNWMLTIPVIRNAARQLGFSDPLIWTYSYNAAPLVRAFSDSFSLYLCNDAFAQIHTNPLIRRGVEKMEHQLLKRVSAVVTVSEKLTKEKEPFNKRILTINHGVDIRRFKDAFAALQSGSASSPPDIASIPHPILGYSGVVRYVVDIPFLEELAFLRPDWSIVIVGPVAESSGEFYERIASLKKRSNVHFLGAKRFDEIPFYNAAYDIGLLPYAKSNLMEYVDSALKFYEYLAAGKPVLSTIGPKLNDADIVRNITTADEAVAEAERLFAAANPAAVDKRLALAEQNSWSHRIEEIERFLSGLQTQ